MLIYSALVAVFLSTACARTHDAAQQALRGGIWEQADLSRSIARTVNALVSNDQRLLITSFHHLGDTFRLTPCPVFTHYLAHKPDLFRPCDLSFDECYALITNYRIDWVVLAPAPGAAADALVGSFKSRWGLVPAAVATSPAAAASDQRDAVYILKTVTLHQHSGM